jgi:hypothetical protein
MRLNAPAKKAAQRSANFLIHADVVISIIPVCPAIGTLTGKRKQTNGLGAEHSLSLTVVRGALSAAMGTDVTTLHTLTATVARTASEAITQSRRNPVPNELKTADGHTVPEKWKVLCVLCGGLGNRPVPSLANPNRKIMKHCHSCHGKGWVNPNVEDVISELAAAQAQIQDLQQGLCGMCNESPSNPVHGSGEGQHAFVTSLAEIMRLNAAVVHQAHRYAALEKRLETMTAALREARSFIVVIECEEGLTTENLIAQIDAALVSEDGQ